MPASAIEAGRKGGESRSAAKLAACRHNGFQKQEPAPPKTEQLSTPEEKQNADAR